MSRASPRDARLAAFDLLQRIQRGATAAAAAEEALADLSDRERALAMELGYGCTRLRARLDAELARLSHAPLDELDPGVLLWLRLGLYQLHEMRVPTHAAVNESVQGARRTEGRGASGFVNAVLRQAVREDVRSEVYPSLESDPVGHLTTWGSHPEWLVRRWLDRWPVDRVARLVELDNQPPEITGRWLTDDVASARARLEDGDIEVESLPPWHGAFRLVQGQPAALLARVPAVIQDPAASAVVDYVGDELPAPVVDACAAPGGKTLGLATGRTVVAGDASTARLRELARAAERVGVSAVPVAMDARRPAVGTCGTLLLDVPCTGTGTLRRRPDARWRQGPGRLDALVELQREMLEAGADLVRAGGLLVYATCSLEPEENQGQVDAFLERHREFRREASSGQDVLPEDVVDRRGDLAVMPWCHGTDGSYAVRLRKGR